MKTSSEENKGMAEEAEEFIFLAWLEKLSQTCWSSPSYAAPAKLGHTLNTGKKVTMESSLPQEGFMYEAFAAAVIEKLMEFRIPLPNNQQHSTLALRALDGELGFLATQAIAPLFSPLLNKKDLLMFPQLLHNEKYKEKHKESEDKNGIRLAMASSLALFIATAMFSNLRTSQGQLFFDLQATPSPLFLSDMFLYKTGQKQSIVLPQLAYWEHAIQAIFSLLAPLPLLKPAASTSYAAQEKNTQEESTQREKSLAETSTAAKPYRHQYQCINASEQPGQQPLFVLEEQRYFYLGVSFEREQSIADELKHRAHLPALAKPEFFESKLTRLEILLGEGEKKQKETSNKAPASKNEQHEAVLRSLQAALAILMGGPGSGKTSLIFKLVFMLLEYFWTQKKTLEAGEASSFASKQRREKALQEKGFFSETLFSFDVQLLAYTGKAAQRINEALTQQGKALEKRLATEIPKLRLSSPEAKALALDMKEKLKIFFSLKAQTIHRFLQERSGPRSSRLGFNTNTHTHSHATNLTLAHGVFKLPGHAYLTKQEEHFPIAEPSPLPLPLPLAIIIDEASMLPIQLLSRITQLCSRFYPKTSLFLLGDPFQLRGIGSPALLPQFLKVFKTLEQRQQAPFKTTGQAEPSNFFAKGLHLSNFSFLKKKYRFHQSSQDSQEINTVSIASSVASLETIMLEERLLEKKQHIENWLSTLTQQGVFYPSFAEYTKAENPSGLSIIENYDALSLAKQLYAIFEKSYRQYFQEAESLFSHYADILQTNTLQTKELQAEIPASMLKAFEALLANFKHKILLCARRVGPFGANELSEQLETQILSHILSKQAGSQKPEFHASSSFFHSYQPQLYPGKPFMIEQNDYQNQVYNGELGFILPQRKNLAQPHCWMENRSFLSDLPALGKRSASTYALTVHKSQGSQYEEAVLVFPNSTESSDALINIELLFTAISRAKKNVLLFIPRQRLREYLYSSSPSDSRLFQRLLSETVSYE